MSGKSHFYLDDIAVSQQEDSVEILDSGHEANFLEVISEVLDSVAPCQGELEEVTVSNMSCQLDNCGLASAIHPNLEVTAA